MDCWRCNMVAARSWKVRVHIRTRPERSRRKGQDQMRSGINAHGSLDKIVGRGGHDVGEKPLRVAIIEREPRALHLDLDAVALEKSVIGGVQAEAVFLNFISRDGFGMVKAFAVAPAKDLSVDH